MEGSITIFPNYNANWRIHKKDRGKIGEREEGEGGLYQSMSTHQKSVSFFIFFNVIIVFFLFFSLRGHLIRRSNTGSKTSWEVKLPGK